MPSCPTIVKDRKSVLALNAPLPGTMGPIWAVMLLVIVVMNVLLRVPAGAVPVWAVIGLGVLLGTGIAILARRAELHRMAAILALERAGKFLDDA